MENKKNPSNFKFHESIDTGTLNSLYDSDFTWIEDIFATVLATYNEDMGAISGQLEAGDKDGVRKAVHKMKPSFGFVGMNDLQEKCRQVEELCKTGSDTDVKQATTSLLGEIRLARGILEEDYSRLKAFNTQGL